MWFCTTPFSCSCLYVTVLYSPWVERHLIWLSTSYIGYRLCCAPGKKSTYQGRGSTCKCCPSLVPVATQSKRYTGSSSFFPAVQLDTGCICQVKALELMSLRGRRWTAAKMVRRGLSISMILRVVLYWILAPGKICHDKLVLGEASD